MASSIAPQSSVSQVTERSELSTLSLMSPVESVTRLLQAGFTRDQACELTISYYTAVAEPPPPVKRRKRRSRRGSRAGRSNASGKRGASVASSVPEVRDPLRDIAAFPHRVDVDVDSDGLRHAGPHITKVPSQEALREKLEASRRREDVARVASTPGYCYLGFARSLKTIDDLGKDPSLRKLLMTSDDRWSFDQMQRLDVVKVFPGQYHVVDSGERSVLSLLSAAAAIASDWPERSLGRSLATMVTVVSVGVVQLEDTLGGAAQRTMDERGFTYADSWLDNLESDLENHIIVVPLSAIPEPARDVVLVANTEAGLREIRRYLPEYRSALAASIVERQQLIVYALFGPGLNCGYRASTDVSEMARFSRSRMQVCVWEGNFPAVVRPR